MVWLEHNGGGSGSGNRCAVRLTSVTCTPPSEGAGQLAQFQLLGSVDGGLTRWMQQRFAEGRSPCPPPDPPWPVDMTDAPHEPHAKESDKTV